MHQHHSQKSWWPFLCWAATATVVRVSIMLSHQQVAMVEAFGQNCPLDNSGLIMQSLESQVLAKLNGSSGLDHSDFSQTLSQAHDPFKYLPIEPVETTTSMFSSLKKRNRKGERTDNYNLKVAFIGDQGIGINPTRVLKMVKKWGAELIVQLGDFDYQDNPQSFEDMYNEVLGPTFPMLAVVGNHDLLRWFGPGGYRENFQRRLDKMSNIKCFGEYGANFVCVWHDMVIVMSGVGTLGIRHAEFIDITLSQYPNVPWKVCVWHKNQKGYQTGDKSDETGYEVYETCRRHGAIVITAHEHSYERTHLMSSFENFEIANTKKTLYVEPGQTFAAVSGLGGESIRYWKDGSDAKPWWAAVAALDNGANYGALMCTFNKHGDKHAAKCKFKDIDGSEWDKFHIVSKPHKVPFLLESTPSNAAAAASKAPKAKRRFVELPLREASDVSTFDFTTGTTTCSPVRLYFLSANSTRHVHVLRFRGLPALRSGESIVGARLQVMGSHPTDLAIKAAGGNRFVAGERLAEVALRGISIRSAVVSDDGVMAVAGDIAVPLCEQGVPLRPNLARIQVQEDSNEKFDDFKKTKAQQDVPLTDISWAKDSDGWEPGEVWVSPDFSASARASWTKQALLQEVQAEQERSVVIIMEGSSAPTQPGDGWGLSWLDLDRAVYGVHDLLGTCLSPTLVIEIEHL